MYKKIIFLIQILCLQCILSNSFALAQTRIMGQGNTDTTTTHAVTVNGTTYNFLIHYNNSSDDPNVNPHLCTATYRDKIKEYLTETLQIFLNPTFASDGIPFKSQLLKSWSYDINPQEIYNNYNFPLSLGFLIKENSRGERVSQLKMMLK